MNEKKFVPVLTYSRVVGYYSCVQTNWNKGKKAEFDDRKTASVTDIIEAVK